jgi:hypothetical protein
MLGDNHEENPEISVLQENINYLITYHKMPPVQREGGYGDLRGLEMTRKSLPLPRIESGLSANNERPSCSTTKHVILPTCKRLLLTCFRKITNRKKVSSKDIRDNLFKTR